MKWAKLLLVILTRQLIWCFKSPLDYLLAFFFFFFFKNLTYILIASNGIVILCAQSLYNIGFCFITLFLFDKYLLHVSENLCINLHLSWMTQTNFATDENKEFFWDSGIKKTVTVTNRVNVETSVLNESIWVTEVIVGLLFCKKIGFMYFNYWFLKLMENAFYLICENSFGELGKQLDKKAKLNFKIWFHKLDNNYNKYIARFLKMCRQSGSEIWSVNIM